MILNVPQIINGKETITQEIVYNYKDFPYQKFTFCETVRKNKTSYLNISAAFDIESTTIPANYPGVYNEKPMAFMYHWQFCIKDCVVFGKRWEEFIELLHFLELKLQLNNFRKLVVYVHNLPYEFQFMKDFIHIQSIFAKAKRKPIKVDTGCIEFRCSYALSNMSLGKFCENSSLCTYYKMVDTYDYRKIRTPDTPMDNDELAYCYIDVRGLCQCIDTLLLEDTIVSIPLTNTGYVRREYRHACNNKEYRKLFERLAMNEHDYVMCRKAFRGGNTHANRAYTYMVCHSIYSMDLQSSYPAAMLLDDYPMSKFQQVKVTSQYQLDRYVNEFCCVMNITIFDLYTDDSMPYIDIAHCYEKTDIKNDNGRVLSAKMVSLHCTNIDLKIIRETYQYSGLLINDCIIAKKGKLPREIRETMIKYYIVKTQLKGVDGKEYEYMKAKNRTNSGFGMMVTDIAHSEIIFSGNEWSEQKPDIAKALEDYYKSKNSFLAYQWGIFVTANARWRLYQGQKIVKNDNHYQDTDSLKFHDWRLLKEFEKMNVETIKLCEAADVPAYAERNGKRYYLGIWDFDGYYKKFITLGAKKYAYVDRKNKLHTTVSGMSKKLGAKAVGNIYNFRIGKVYHDIGRTTAYYNDMPPQQITVDDCTFLSASNIGIVDTTYELGVTNEYWEIIGCNRFWEDDIE